MTKTLLWLAVLTSATLVPSANAGLLQTFVSNFSLDHPDGDQNNPAVYLSNNNDGYSGIASVQNAFAHLDSAGGGFAEGTAIATYGTLKAQAISFEPDSGFGYDSAHANALVGDSITVNDPTLNIGDPVNLLFYLAVDPASSITPDVFGTQATYECGTTCAQAVYGLQIADGPSLDYTWDEATHSPNLQTLIVPTTVGATIGFSYQLTLTTFTLAVAAYGGGSNNYNINFLDTTNLYIGSSDPNAQLVSGSGFDYSAAPEPGSWILAGPVALWLTWRRKRR